MTTRLWHIILGVSPIAALFVALSLFTPSARAARVMVVLSAEAAPYRDAEKSLRAGLERERHTVETGLLSSLSGKTSTELSSVAELVVAIGTEAGVWLHERLPESVALVYCMVTDPESAGLTKGRSCRGIRVDVPVSDQLKTIEEALPRAKVVGMLYRGDNAKSKRIMNALEGDLPKGWRLEAVAIEKHATVAEAITDLLNRGVDVVWTAADSSVYDSTAIRALLLASLRKKVPVFGFSAPCVRAGALVGLSVEPKDQGEEAASLVVSALAEARRPDEPKTVAHKAPKHKILINTSVAEQLQIELPRSFLDRASAVSGKGSAS